MILKLWMVDRHNKNCDIYYYNVIHQKMIAWNFCVRHAAHFYYQLSCVYFCIFESGAYKQKFIDAVSLTLRKWVHCLFVSRCVKRRCLNTNIEVRQLELSIALVQMLLFLRYSLCPQGLFLPEPKKYISVLISLWEWSEIAHTSKPER